MTKESVCCNCQEVHEFINLVDKLVNEIHHLELEVIRTRHKLSNYLPEPYSLYLLTEIFSNLARRYSDDSAYQQYMEQMYDNQDPLESDNWVNEMLKVIGS